VLIADGIRASAQRVPTKVALSLGEDRLTYAQLVERSNRVANLARDGLGLSSGDRTALMAPNCLEFVEIVCGLATAGMPAAMINPRLTPGEVAYIANDSGARVLFVHESLAGVVEEAELETVERVVVIGGDYEELLAQARPQAPVAQLEEWDPFCISYTSGTTGNPKGAVLSHRSRALTFFAMAVEYGCYSPEDRAIAIAPLYQGGGFAFAMAPIAFGGTCEILPKFDPEHVLRLIPELGITNTFMVPTHFNALFALDESVREGADLASLRTIISNAAPLPQATKERIVDWLGDGILHETYGSTEGGIVTNLRPPDQLRKEQCVGLPFPCTEVRLLDGDGVEVEQGEIGELHSRSPYLFNGYWELPDATTDAFHEGWLSVGDMARTDEEGYIYIVDRKKDMIISGGVNVYPREVEEVLHDHPAVAEAAVVGVPDEYWGEAVRAVVALRTDSTATSEEIVEFCSSRLASFKLPKTLEFVDALPRNAAGKVLRRELRDESRDDQ
jgi:acyl-CoA synthetase (AMP-forming)/AMP-acid ligase II